MTPLEKEFPELFSEAFDVSIGPGWEPAARELCRKIIAISPEVRVLQLKQKFGGARCYVGFAPAEVHSLIDEFETATFSICERCGGPGRPRSSKHGWVTTLCEEHTK